MAITAVALGRVRENYYLDHRYVTAARPPLGGGFRASPEWQPLQDWGRKASHQRIGVFGRASAFGQYFFYGNDLSNHVQYLGDEGNHGTFRPIYSCALWRQTINEGHYDYVVTTPALGVIETVAPPAEPLDLRGPERADRDPVRSGRRLQDRRAARSLHLRRARGRGARMSFGDYLQGSIELIVVAAAMGYAAVALRGRLLPGWSGASARLAEVVLGLSLLVVIAELVGVVGLYRPGWVLLATIVVGVGVGLALRPPRPGHRAAVAAGCARSRWRSRSRPRCWSPPTGRCRPRPGSTSACTCRTPPGTTRPSPPASSRTTRSARSTSPRSST